MYLHKWFMYSCDYFLFLWPGMGNAVNLIPYVRLVREKGKDHHPHQSATLPTPTNHECLLPCLPFLNDFRRYFLNIRIFMFLPVNFSGQHWLLEIVKGTFLFVSFFKLYIYIYIYICKRVCPRPWSDLNPRWDSLTHSSTFFLPCVSAPEIRRFLQMRYKTPTGALEPRAGAT